MYLGDRLRELRHSKGLSQGDLEKRTGLRRSYISRLENDHTVPALATLEKMSRALGIQTYQIFCTNKQPEQLFSSARVGLHDWASNGRGSRLLAKLEHALSCMTVVDRELLLHMARVLAKDSRDSHQ